MVSLTFVFITCQTLVPRYFMCKAHLKIAIFTGDFRVVGTRIIELTVFAEGSETPAEIGVIRKKSLQEELLISSIVLGIV